VDNQVRIEVDCLHVGEYLDEAESPPNVTAHQAEVVRSRFVANYIDIGSGEVVIKEFTVLLKDGRIVSVYGNGLKYFPTPTVNGESGSYGIITRTGGEEVINAFFKVIDVIGIFHGKVRSDRKIA